MNRMYGKSALLKMVLAFFVMSQAAIAHAQQAGNTASSDSGGQLWLTSGFFSHHFNREPHYNERNTGLGIEYFFNESTAVAIGHYRNSVRRSSTYLHFVYTPLEIGSFRLGGAVGVLDGYPELRNGRYSPAVLPVGTSTFKLFNHDVGVNLTYIPTISHRVDGALAIQFKIRIG